MNLITAEHLTHSYTERILFKNAAFSLNEKDKVGIIGINGTGKSTLLKILAGKETPDSGTVTTGRNLRIAYLPQTPSFDGKETTLTAALPSDSEIAVSPDTYEPEAKAYLTKLGFTDFSQPVMELSGGQWQKLAIARGLFRESEMIVLDEPTSALDPKVENEILTRFIELAKDKTTVIISHRVGLCKAADRIAVMKDGKVMEVGSHEELLRNHSLYKQMWEAQASWYVD